MAVATVTDRGRGWPSLRLPTGGGAGVAVATVTDSRGWRVGVAVATVTDVGKCYIRRPSRALLFSILRYDF